MWVLKDEVEAKRALKKDRAFDGFMRGLDWMFGPSSSHRVYGCVTCAWTGQDPVVDPKKEIRCRACQGPAHDLRTLTWIEP